jgi:RNA-directed DNA polymerase
MGFPHMGFPQGGVISRLLMNITLHGLGNHVCALSTERKKPVMIRYADDFVFLCKSYDPALEALRNAEGFLLGRGLKFKETSAPAVVHITQGLNFLGCSFRRISNYGYDKALTVRPPIFKGNVLFA